VRPAPCKGSIFGCRYDKFKTKIRRILVKISLTAYCIPILGARHLFGDLVLVFVQQTIP
jgi:hypothetical protein